MPQRAPVRTRRPSGPSSAARFRAPRPRPPPPRGRRPATRAGSSQCRAALAIPRDRPGEALVEVDLRLESEHLTRLLDVRDPQLDVCVVERTEDDLAGRLGQPLYPLGEVEDRHRRARVADVERLADRLVALQAEKQRVDHVVDVAPRPDLGAVAVDRQAAARERRLDEGADRPTTDLSGAEDVEGPDGDDGDP